MEKYKEIIGLIMKDSIVILHFIHWRILEIKQKSI